MLASMVVGAVIVVGADLLTRVVIPFAVPAGLVTAVLGAPYLIWLLLRSNKKVTCMTHVPSPRYTVTVGYGAEPVVRDLSLAIPDGKVTTIVGPNGCGKSTLLRTMARLLKPTSGQVVLDGEPITSIHTREIAKRMALLPQSPVAPEGLLVRDLVGRGRHPHQRWFAQWSEHDEDIVGQALALTDTADLADRPLDQLSGGQRQRAWIAMTLAQDTDLMLLDEPTTYLDLAHQVEVLDLVSRLNRERGRTVAMVLHDLNLAARYSDLIVVMKDGAVVTEGTRATCSPSSCWPMSSASTPRSSRTRAPGCRSSSRPRARSAAPSPLSSARRGHLGARVAVGGRGELGHVAVQHPRDAQRRHEAVADVVVAVGVGDVDPPALVVRRRPGEYLLDLLVGGEVEPDDRADVARSLVRSELSEMPNSLSSASVMIGGRSKPRSTSIRERGSSGP